jgi:hypothetical protein
LSSTRTGKMQLAVKNKRLSVINKTLILPIAKEG